MFTRFWELLRSANVERDVEWCKKKGVTLSPTYRGCELGGEAGEAGNVLKKIERERLGLVGSRATVDQLAEELADVVICADLAAMDFGIDLELAVVQKFNKTSEENKLPTRMSLNVVTPMSLDLARAVLRQCDERFGLYAQHHKQQAEESAKAGDADAAQQRLAKHDSNLQMSFLCREALNVLQEFPALPPAPLKGCQRDGRECTGACETTNKCPADCLDIPPFLRDKAN